DRLLSLVVDAVHGQITLPPSRSSQPWTARLRNLAQAIYKVYAAYPGVASILDEGVLAGPQTLSVLDCSMSILLEAGFDPATALRCSWPAVMADGRGGLRRRRTGPRLTVSPPTG